MAEAPSGSSCCFCSMWPLPLLPVLHWRKQVTWSRVASVGKKCLLQGWAGREDLERKGQQKHDLLQYIFGCSGVTKRFRLLRSTSSWRWWAGRFTAILSSTLIMRIYWLYLYYCFGDPGRHWILYMIAAY